MWGLLWGVSAAPSPAPLFEVRSILRVHGDPKLHEVGVVGNLRRHLRGGCLEGGGGVRRVYDEGVVPLTASAVSDGDLKAHPGIYRWAAELPILRHDEATIRGAPHRRRRTTPVRLFYQLAVSALRVISPLLSLGSAKLAKGIAGRRHADQALAAWGETLRDPARPTMWIHAPSVGEGLQARAVKDALKERRSDVQVVFTHFSPSAEAFAADFGADATSYLPWDLRGPIARVLDGVAPDVLVFTKTEIWPVLVAEATRRGIPVAIVGATVPDGSGRTTLPARLLMRDAWASLDLGCAISDVDAGRLVSLGLPADAVRVTGDPGIDSAARRFAHAASDAPYLTPFRSSPRPTVVAGSTWAADEAVLLPALRQVRDRIDGLRVIVAPHEPGSDHVENLLGLLGEDGWSATTLGETEREGAAEAWNAVVVDRVGVLAHLYGVADASYVGGGFHDDGLHSVLEPAAAATPVVFGPKHSNARAAGDLLRSGGAKLAANADDLTEILTGWLADPRLRDRAGTLARDYIESHLGAARRTAEHLDELLTRP